MCIGRTKMALDFDTLQEEQRVHVLGRGIDATVKTVDRNRYGKARTVKLLFDDGKEVTYSRANLACVATDNPAPESVPSPEHELEDALKAPPAAPQPVRGHRIKRRPTPPAPKTAPAAPVAVPRPRLQRKQVKVERRPIPMIPGPPVPKPTRGAWSV